MRSATTTGTLLVGWVVCPQCATRAGVDAELRWCCPGCLAVGTARPTEQDSLTHELRAEVKRLRAENVALRDGRAEAMEDARLAQAEVERLNEGIQRLQDKIEHMDGVDIERLQEIERLRAALAEMLESFTEPEDDNDILRRARAALGRGPMTDNTYTDLTRIGELLRERDKLREALRRQAIGRTRRVNGQHGPLLMHCAQCFSTWPASEPERHGDDCLCVNPGPSVND
jgi:chromosome segregation ATPase